jgi:hypothetical protein
VPGVRVLCDPDMLLEGYSFDTSHTDAPPKLLTRQPWPPAWSDSPAWLPIAGAPHKAELAHHEAAIAAVTVATAASAVPWRPLASGAHETALTADEPGGAAITPFVERDKRRAPPQASKTICSGRVGSRSARSRCSRRRTHSPVWDSAATVRKIESG